MTSSILEPELTAAASNESLKPSTAGNSEREMALPRPPLATPTRDRRTVVRAQLLWGLTAVSVIAFLLIGSYALRLASNLRTLETRTAAVMDSLVLARQFDSLMTEIFDLEQEVYARQSGVIPPEIQLVKLPVILNGSPLGQMRPVPWFSSDEPNASQRRQAQEHLRQVTRASSEHGRIRTVYEQPDLVRSGAVDGLMRFGFSAVATTAAKSGPTNSLVFGPNVSLEHVRLVAYQLIASGHEVKRIRHTDDPNRENTIELMHSRQVYDWPGLTLAQLQGFKSQSID